MGLYQGTTGQRPHCVERVRSCRLPFPAKEYNDAIVSISKAEEYSTRTDDLFQQGLIHMAKENIYSFCYNNSEARHEALQGIDAFEKINEKTLALKAKRKLAMDDVALKDFHHADSILLSIINREDIDSSFYARTIWFRIHTMLS